MFILIAKAERRALLFLNKERRMKYRKLTDDGDYSFGSNELDYVDGNMAIAQAIKTKILLFYQEWWEDVGLGIPMFQSFLGQMNPEVLSNSLPMVVEERVLEVQGVKSVEDVQVKLDKIDRRVEMLIIVRTTTGELVEVEVGV